jgi:RHS repeat-associated protein
LTLQFYNGSGWVAYDDAVLKPVNGSNLLTNPGFEASGGWSSGSPSSIGSNTSITRGTWGFATPKTGTYAYSMSTDAYGNIRSDQFPVTAGQGYDVAAWIRGEVDTDDSRDGTVWIVRVRWEDLNGDYLSYSNAEVGSAASGLPSSFTEKGGTVTAPTGAVYGRAEIYFYLASGWLNVDDVSVTPTTTTNVSETKYYGFGGDTVGMRVDGELSWIFSDQLGSTGITYQADGSGTSRQFYYPFGGIRNPGGSPVVDTDVGFTGQRLDETTGLMFYQARYYDPLTARFISADTIVPDPGNPQDFNRYTYVRNNPLRYTDPTGNIALDCLSPFDDPSNGCGGGSFAPEIVEDLVTPLKVVAIDAPLTAGAATVGFVFEYRVKVFAVVTAVACVGATLGAGTVVCFAGGAAFFVSSAQQTIVSSDSVGDALLGLLGDAGNTAALMLPALALKFAAGSSWAWGATMTQADLVAQAAAWSELAFWQKVYAAVHAELLPLGWNLLVKDRDDPPSVNLPALLKSGRGTAKYL